MDSLNSFMDDQNFNKPLKEHVRAFFNETRNVAKTESYKGLINRMSPSLKEDVTEKNCAWIHTIPYFKDASAAFAVTVLDYLNAGVFVPQENINLFDTLCVVGRGVASRAGVVKTAGGFWGDDFILDCWDLKENVTARALTYVEILMLDRSSLYAILEEFDEETIMVRKAVMKMSRYRGILMYAKAMKIQGLTGAENMDYVEIEHVPLPSQRSRRSTAFSIAQGTEHGNVSEIIAAHSLHHKQVLQAHNQAYEKTEHTHDKIGNIETRVKYMEKTMKRMEVMLEQAITKT